MPTIQYAQFESVVEPSIRITEASDIRITEAGDTRITNDAANNTAESSMVADPLLIPLSKGAYVKVSGVWQLFVPYVKYNGTWQQPNAIYKKTSGIWQRVY
jgi:hypothetical protein